ncbi:MAG: hypothetical protein DHS20C01_14320 [marine bacterium B5-7]|nr:MAG: hypothetical protein DHS20C01_14320 [marine bacterium B5-7]
MYSKVYRITCSPGQADALLGHYDAHVVPAIKASEHHVGHHMIQTGADEWLLVSNYVSEDAATISAPMVQEIVKPMAEQFGMQLEPVTQGDVNRSF